MIETRNSDLFSNISLTLENICLGACMVSSLTCLFIGPFIFFLANRKAVWKRGLMMQYMFWGIILR